MFRKRFAMFMEIGLLLLLVAGMGLAQSTFGSITGVTTDPTGSVVPNAQIQVINEGTGAVRSVLTSSAGVFNVPSLDVGTYRIKISASGFTTYERSGLELVANQILNVNAQLEVGAVSTVTQVEATTPVISTETSDIFGTMSHDMLEQLPLVGRHDGGTGGIYTYVQLTTGASTVFGVSTPVVNGARVTSGTLPTMDGIAVMAYPQGAGPVQPGMEGIQEVKTETAVAPAEFTTAANFQVVSKSGTNRYHGSVFYTYNSSDFNARNFYSPTVAFNVYNNFGASIGGPVIKNKLFFFVDYEGSRDATTQNVVESVPLPAWMTGNLGGMSAQLMNPFTKQPFPGNVIPASLISPVSQKIQSYIWPAPNAGAPGVVANNWSANFPTIGGFEAYDNVDARMDFTISAKDSLFARVSYRRLPSGIIGVYPLSANQIRWGDSAVAAWTHIFSPGLLNEFRFGVTYHRNYYYSKTPGNTLLSQFGVTGVPTTGWGTDPFFNINGVTPWSPDAGSVDYEDNPEPSFEWIDNVSWNHGRHFLKFGFDAIHERLGGNNVNANVYGEYDFSGVYTGSGYGDFLLGIPQTVELAIPNPSRNLRGGTYGLYAQDQFKVNSRLTINYGLRWELEEPYTDKHGLLYNFNPASGDLVIPDNALSRVNPFYPKNIPIETASQAGYPANTLLRTQWKEFQPRVGLAYKPFGGKNTVVRAGYGIYGNLVYSGLARLQMSGGPYSGSVTYFNSITNGTPLLSFPSPFLASGQTATQNVSGVNPNFKVPYTQQWQFSIEQQVGPLGLRISYLGSKSDQLGYLRNLNQPAASLTKFTTAEFIYPLYNQVLYADNGGTAFYNGLELAAEKRYGQNLTLSSGFTWAKDLTDTQDNNSWGGPLIQNTYCRACEKGPNLDTLPKRFYAYALYMLPVGKGQRFLPRLSAPLQAILGGWQTSYVALLQSGRYYTPSFSGFDTSNTNTIGGRPDVVSGVSRVPPGGGTITEWFNPAAFEIPGCPDSTPRCSSPTDIGRFGNAGVGVLEGPSFRNLDFSLSKNFKLTEKLRMKFISTMSNVLNHPNFTTPAANISSAGTVGVISGLARGLQIQPFTREIDFGLRLEF